MDLWITYSLLCELTSTLVLGVTEEFDDTTLVWGKAARNISQMFEEYFFDATRSACANFVQAQRTTPR